MLIGTIFKLIVALPVRTIEHYDWNKPVTDEELEAREEGFALLTELLNCTRDEFVNQTDDDAHTMATTAIEWTSIGNLVGTLLNKARDADINGKEELKGIATQYFRLVDITVKAGSQMKNNNMSFRTYTNNIAQYKEAVDEFIETFGEPLN